MLFCYLFIQIFYYFRHPPTYLLTVIFCLPWLNISCQQNRKVDPTKALSGNLCHQVPTYLKLNNSLSFVNIMGNYFKVCLQFRGLHVCYLKYFINFLRNVRTLRRKVIINFNCSTKPYKLQKLGITIIQNYSWFLLIPARMEIILNNSDVQVI